MPIKRFITTFLLLSLLTGSVTLVLSELVLEQSQIAQINSESTATNNNSDTTSPKNAYVEGLPTSTLSNSGNTVLANGDGNIDGQNIGNTTITASDNLTESYAQYFVNEVKRGNPDGPIPAADNGDPLVAMPDEARAAEMLSEVIDQKPISFASKPDNKDVKILQSPTREEGANYIRSVGEILDQTLNSQEFSRLLEQSNPDTQLITAGELVYNKALEQTRALSVPEPFLAFHNKLLGFLQTQANLLSAASRHGDDPLRAILAIEQAGQLTQSGVSELQTEVSRLQAISYQSWPQSPLAILSESLGGPLTAHALIFVPVGDILNLPAHVTNASHNTSSFWQKILEFVLQTLVDTFIDRLVTLFQNQVVAWIQGDGKPKFVTDWNGFLEDIVDQATGETIRKIAPQLCKGFGPMVTFYFKKVPPINTRVSCTLTQVAANMEKFANNFMDGGWLSYGETMDPHGNFFGAMIDAHDIITEQAAARGAAEADKLKANVGFKGIEVCTEYSYETIDVGDNCENGYDMSTQEPCEQKQVKGACAHRETMTPGGAIAHSLDGAMNWKIDRVINAHRLNAVVGAIVDAAINRTIKFGLANITGLLKSGGGTKANPNSTKVDQYGYKLETDYPALSEDKWVASSAAQSNSEINTDAATGQAKVDKAQDTVQNESADTALINLKQAKSSSEEWLSIVPLAFQSLNQTVSTCPSAAAEAMNDTNDLNDKNANMIKQDANIGSAITKISALPGNPPAPSDVSGILSDLDIGSTETLKAELIAAVEELKGLKNWADNACPLNPFLNSSSTIP